MKVKPSSSSIYTTILLFLLLLLITQTTSLPSTTESYYKTLNLTQKTFSPKLLKSNYKKLCLLWHPDKILQRRRRDDQKIGLEREKVHESGVEPESKVKVKTNNAKEKTKKTPEKRKGKVDDTLKFKRINEAYTILSDPKKKNEYDSIYGGKGDWFDPGSPEGQSQAYGRGKRGQTGGGGNGRSYRNNMRQFGVGGMNNGGIDISQLFGDSSAGGGGDMKDYLSRFFNAGSGPELGDLGLGGFGGGGGNTFKNRDSRNDVGFTKDEAERKEFIKIRIKLSPKLFNTTTTTTTTTKNQSNDSVIKKYKLTIPKTTLQNIYTLTIFKGYKSGTKIKFRPRVISGVGGGEGGGGKRYCQGVEFEILWI